MPVNGARAASGARIAIPKSLIRTDPRVEEDVRRLQIAVENAARVRSGEACAQLASNATTFSGGGGRRGEQRREIFAVDRAPS